MEAAPRLPMICFELLSSQENVQFSRKLKPYIASFYNEDPDGYTREINKLDTLRVSATHPSTDILGLQALKKYYCQLHFLKSRFPMDPGQLCFIEFEWKDCQNGTASGGINFELMVVLYNIGVLHSILGALDSRSNPEGMKLACSHFQCAVWAFQTVKEKYADAVSYITSLDVPHFYKQVCLAQAQECILEKSMLDNRKSTIISKVAVQVWDYYRQALTSLKGINEDVVGRGKYKDWVKYLQFKIAYHRCVSLLFQGQQAEELQKMGERLAFYQGACEYLQEASKYLSSKQQKELADALAFTTDVVEGKRKAAKNENEYIYHEEVPDLANLQEVKGASLVKGIEFNVNDPEVSGPDIFQRLVPMEAHEAASVYSEKKAEVLRNMGQRLEIKDQALVEFMSSMQLDLLTKMHQATGIPQELIDRAASLSAQPNAIQSLIDEMARLSSIYHDVEANLTEIDSLLKNEEENERSYQEVMGKRPPSIITTDLAREASKYKEAHTKANESNETLSKAMMTHLENLKILQRPIRELQQKLPSVELPDSNIDQNALKELEMLNSKVDEMKSQRAMLWAQLRDSIHNDDITNALVTKQPNQSLEEVFRTQLDKHGQLIEVLDQNLAAQDNIKKAFIECYAKAVNTRRYIHDMIQKRNSTIQALITSHDSYDDLLAKAMKGVEFYRKLEVNVSKLLQRIKSASKVQQEEREQMLSKNAGKKDEVSPAISNVAATASAPKLKDYLEARKKAAAGFGNFNYGSENPNWPPGVRPAPVGSEITTDTASRLSNNNDYYYQNYGNEDVTQITDKMNSLMATKQLPGTPHYNYPYSSYTPQSYSPASYTYSSQHYVNTQGVQTPVSGQDSNKAFTTSTNSYHTITSYMQNIPQGSDATFTQHSQGQQQPPQMQQQASQQQQNRQMHSQKTTQLQQQITQLRQHQQSSQLQQQQFPHIQQQPSQVHQQQSTQLQQQQQTPLQQQHQTSQIHQQQITPLQQQQQTPQLQQQQFPQTAQQQTIRTQQQQQQTPQQLQIQQQYYYQLPQNQQANQQTPSESGYTYGSAMQSQVTPRQNLHDTTGAQNYTAPSLQYQASQSQPQYFPQGYAPNHVNPVNVSTQNTYAMNAYQPQYYTQQHSSSVASTTYMDNFPTYSSPGTACQTYAGAPKSSTATPYNPYGSVYGYNYTTESAAISPQVSANTSHKESNVDLLTGLDFSASSNIPTLTPQQNLPPEPVKLSSVIEIKTPKQELPINVPHKQDIVIRVLPSKPLNNPDVKALFSQDLEKLEKYVETLTTKTLSGPTTLEVKWKEIQDNQEPQDILKRTISVARCYPMKNRFPDILPYDYSRVELKSVSDDYINASFVKQVSPFGPQFIVTQAPLQSTFGDFWAMVREQQVEVIFCLLNDNELQGDVYWPTTKGQNVTILNQNLVLSLQNVLVKQYWTERIIYLTIPEKKESWTVMHVQFTAWPGSLFPTSPEPFISLVLELITQFQQQKSMTHPILIHCASGIGRSGLLCLLANTILDVTNQANIIPDLAVLATQLGHFRKNILRDREHFKFAYEALICYVKQLLAQDGLRRKLNDVVNSSTDKENSASVVTVVEEPIIDPLSTLDPFWASKK
ncbi:tyrosine-protein phosphatase non-receptor type 23 [Euwallacea similis]|uniref:tyrosine-protein phosphatase non-receptor type 23 n=1 Tax=Euwallacea similis TaxID=1736056 RepID=UPI00344D39A1